MSDATPGTEVPSDAELITAVRSGATDRYGELYRRHVGSATAFAKQLAASASEVDDLVAEAFTKVLDALTGGKGPDLAFRSYLLTTLRNIAYERHRRARPVTLSDDLGEVPDQVETQASVFEDIERSLAAKAFQRLPERWQAVLWYTEIEGQNPAEIAPLLGLNPNGVSALAYRAREGLRQAYLQVHLADTENDRCRATVQRLGTWARGRLSKREAAQVDAHLDGCAQCRALAAELVDLNGALRAAAAPLVLGAGAAGYLAAAENGGLGAAGAAGSGAAGSGAAGSGAAGSGAAGGGQAGGGAGGAAGQTFSAAVAVAAGISAVGIALAAEPASLAQPQVLRPATSVTPPATTTPPTTTPPTTTAPTTTAPTTVPTTTVPTTTAAATTPPATSPPRPTPPRSSTPGPTTPGPTTPSPTTPGPTPPPTTTPPPAPVALTVSTATLRTLPGAHPSLPVTVRNTGGTASGPLVVTLALPEGITARGGDGVRCTRSGGITTCALGVSLAPGAQWSGRIRLQVSVFSTGGTVVVGVTDGTVRATAPTARVEVWPWG